MRRRGKREGTLSRAAGWISSQSAGDSYAANRHQNRFATIAPDARSPAEKYLAPDQIGTFGNALSE
jgi:hypothetical protein